jgi:hypothetical protein
MTGFSIATTGASKPTTAPSRTTFGSSSASTKLRRVLGSQCAYHWSVVGGLAVAELRGDVGDRGVLGREQRGERMPLMPVPA